MEMSERRREEIKISGSEMRDGRSSFLGVQMERKEGFGDGTARNSMSAMKHCTAL